MGSDGVIGSQRIRETGGVSSFKMKPLPVIRECLGWCTTPALPNPPTR